jgi:hypothetical protein
MASNDECVPRRARRVALIQHLLTRMCADVRHGLAIAELMEAPLAGCGPVEVADAEVVPSVRVAVACRCDQRCSARIDECPGLLSYLLNVRCMTAAERAISTEVLLLATISQDTSAGPVFSLPFIGEVCRPAFASALGVSDTFVTHRVTRVLAGTAGASYGGRGNRNRAAPERDVRALHLFADVLRNTCIEDTLPQWSSGRLLFDLYREWIRLVNGQLQGARMPIVAPLARETMRRYCVPLRPPASFP